jgi:hypothetical protein
MKSLDLDQIAARKAQGVRFTRDLLGMMTGLTRSTSRAFRTTPRPGFQIVNPTRRKKAVMANGKTKGRIGSDVADLQDENQELQDQLALPLARLRAIEPAGFTGVHQSDLTLTRNDKKKLFQVT